MDIDTVASLQEQGSAVDKTPINEVAGGTPAPDVVESKQKAPRRKKPKVCRFYLSKNGCRAGSECRFVHPKDEDEKGDISPDTAPGSNTAAKKVQSDVNGDHNTTANRPQRKLDALPVREKPQVIRRPVPQAQTQDPRAFQLSQIQRRFKPDISEQSGETILRFSMKPTDPDFPYEIDELECVMTVPTSFPSSGHPSLRVLNKDIPRGFQINIERGFNSIATGAGDATLLSLMNRLDRQLEAILSGKMVETIKLVPNRGTAPERAKPEPPPVVKPVDYGSPETGQHRRVFTEEEKVAARQRRAAHTRQLEARFSRVPQFAKSSDASTFTLPLDSSKKSTWPAPLRDLRTFRLHVSDEYPLVPATLLLDSDSAEARAVEKSYEEQSSKMVDATLTSQINYLLQHIGEMATQRNGVATVLSSPVVTFTENTTVQVTQGVHHKDGMAQALDHDRPHIQVIPRPPEWDKQDDDSEHTESESEYDTFDDSGSDAEDDQQNSNKPDQQVSENNNNTSSSTPVEKGVLLSFPHMELHGIELLELVSLDITIKCERCKDTMDVHKLRNYNGEASAMRDETCKKCARGLAVGFRTDLIHANSARAGYLDLDGCQVIDMLPSTFIPTCAECSTAHPAPGVVSVRGDSTLSICRECHHRMTFRIPEVKFLQISASSLRASRATGRKKVKENLGITAGTELPKRGRCSHYSKSQRWFRFSCCSKVYPCDRCHDAAEDHPLEHANRMLCGYCSREQNYRPEDCGICHAVLIGKRGKGFWEGGKGTRDPKRMSRKDPRKYKRRPGTKTKD